MPEPKPEVVYRFTGKLSRAGRPPFAGVPARDLTARDVARLDAATIKRITGGETPAYVPVKTEAAKEARADAGAPEAPAKAKGAKE